MHYSSYTQTSHDTRVPTTLLPQYKTRTFSTVVIKINAHVHVYLGHATGPRSTVSYYGVVYYCTPFRPDERNRTET